MTRKNSQTTTEETVTARKPKTRLVVREAFGHEGVYYTNDNINDAPKEVVDARIKSGKIVEEPLPPEETVEEKA